MFNLTFLVLIFFRYLAIPLQTVLFAIIGDASYSLLNFSLLQIASKIIYIIKFIKLNVY